VPDLRNSKVIDIIRGLTEWGHRVDVHDPHADPEEAKHEYGVALLDGLKNRKGYDCVVGAVSHKEYAGFGVDQFRGLLGKSGLVADVKGMWRKLDLPKGIERWQI
jgi:UDP-N-acetyl-D-glucosamine/UDP-N-acetyl-D-galactosamine dehydrogenase